LGGQAQQFPNQNKAKQTLVEVTEYRRARRSDSANIEVTGRITFTGKAPQTIPPNSQLKVKFIDIIKADVPHVELANTIVDLSNYKNNTPLFYNITSKRPTDLHNMHSISAVLNMGWTPKGGASDEWLRHGDYHTTHSFMVNVTSRKDKFDRDIDMGIYLSSSSTTVLCGKYGPVLCKIITLSDLSSTFELAYRGKLINLLFTVYFL
jgi:hypothetical protein